MIEARIQLLILTVNKMFQGIKSERPAHVSANTPFLNNYVTSNLSNTHPQMMKIKITACQIYYFSIDIGTRIANGALVIPYPTIFRE